jgi:hypothetical protein
MKDYHSTHLVDYDEPKTIGYCGLPVLPFLIHHKWDEMALAFVHSLRPSCIRVTNGEEKTDAVLWRVTVHVDYLDSITSITQECEVGLDPNFEHGFDLRCKAIKRGMEIK